MPNIPNYGSETTVTESRVCPRCGIQVPLQKSGAAVGIRPCPGCGRPISVRSQRGRDNFVGGERGEFVSDDSERDRELELARQETVTDGQETLPWPNGFRRGAVDETPAQPIARKSRRGWPGLVLFGVACAAVCGSVVFVGNFFNVPVEQNLDKIGRAVQNYIKQNNGMLPHADIGPNGETGLSWRVHLLPYFDDPQLLALYQEFHLDESWDSSHNLQLIQRMPAVYRSPDVFRQGMTSLHFFTGPETPLGGSQPQLAKNCIDGAACTILAILAGSEMAETWTSPGGVLLTPEPLTNAGSPRREVYSVVMLDGKVRRLRYDLNPKYVRALIIHDDLYTLDLEVMDKVPKEITLPAGTRVYNPNGNVTPDRIKYVNVQLNSAAPQLPAPRIRTPQFPVPQIPTPQTPAPATPNSKRVK